MVFTNSNIILFSASPAAVRACCESDLLTPFTVDSGSTCKINLFSKYRKWTNLHTLVPDTQLTQASCWILAVPAQQALRRGFLLFVGWWAQAIEVTYQILFKQEQVWNRTTMCSIRPYSSIIRFRAPSQICLWLICVSRFETTSHETACNCLKVLNKNKISHKIKKKILKLITFN